MTVSTKKTDFNSRGMIRRFLLIWSIYWLVYLLQPTYSIYPRILDAFVLQAAFVLIVSLSFMVGLSITRRHVKLLPDPRSRDFETGKNLISFGLWISVFGFIFLLYDKVAIQQIDYSQGLAVARHEWRMLGEERSSAVSSIFSAIGYLIGGAFFLSLALSVSNRIQMDDYLRIKYIILCLFMLLLNSLITGGRSSILLAAIFCSFSYFSYNKNTKFGIFSSHHYARIFNIIISLSFLYILYIFYLRSLSSDQYVGAYSIYFLEYLGLAPDKWFVDFAYTTSWGELFALLNLTISYLTHSLTTTAAILQTSDYSGNAIFVNFMQIGSKLGIVSAPKEWFLSGRFASLPGSLYLQYGSYGLVIGAVSLGYFSGFFAKSIEYKPQSYYLFLACSVFELTLLMSPFLLAWELLFFPSLIIGSMMILVISSWGRKKYS